jgi:uncharacterized protein YggE
MMLMLSCLLALPVLAVAQSHTPSPAVVVSQGTSVLRVAPDQAWVTVAVETRDAKAPEARRLAAVAMTSVMAALKTTGLPEDAIRTTGFSLSPDYEYVSGRQRMRGFVVSNRVQVRIDDIAKVADVLDSVGGLSLAASSTLTVANLRFDLKDRSAVEREALRLAVEDALANARAMAAGAGVKAGRIVRIDQVGQRNDSYQLMEASPMMARAAGDSSMPTPISPAEILITAMVTVQVEIL